MISCFYIRTLTIVSILFLNICCGSNQESNKKIIPVHDPIIKDSSLYDDVRLKELKDTTIPKKINIDLKKAKNIEILSINKEMGKDSTDGEYYEKCKSWSLTIGQLKTVIREFKSMSSVAQDLSYSYMHLPNYRCLY